MEPDETGEMEPRAKICMQDAFADLSKTTASVGALLNMFDRGPGARETKLAFNKLQEARHWLQDAADIVGFSDE